MSMMTADSGTSIAPLLIGAGIAAVSGLLVWKSQVDQRKARLLRSVPRVVGAGTLSLLFNRHCSEEAISTPIAIYGYVTGVVCPLDPFDQLQAEYSGVPAVAFNSKMTRHLETQTISAGKVSKWLPSKEVVSNTKRNIDFAIDDGSGIVIKVELDDVRSIPMTEVMDRYIPYLDSTFEGLSPTTSSNNNNNNNTNGSVNINVNVNSHGNQQAFGQNHKQHHQQQQQQHDTILNGETKRRTIGYSYQESALKIGAQFLAVGELALTDDDFRNQKGVLTIRRPLPDGPHAGFPFELAVNKTMNELVKRTSKMAQIAKVVGFIGIGIGTMVALAGFVFS